MAFWDIKLYEDREERETIRALPRAHKLTLMAVFDRLGVHAEARKYEDGERVKIDSVNAPEPFERGDT